MLSQAKHDVKYPTGAAAIDLKVAYPNVMEDLQVCFCFI